MGIYDKLEEIRKKPEHVRRRYVWGMLAVSMAVVMAVWILSFCDGREAVAPDREEIGASGIVEQFNHGRESLKNASEGFQGFFQQQAARQTQQEQQQPDNSAPDASSVDTGNVPDLISR